jgi:hypothetical protein
MEKKSIHEWARIFACEGLVAISDVDRLYGKMLRKVQASGLWETAETELRANNREVKIFTKDEARDIAEACLPMTPQYPKAKTPRTIKGAVCGTTEGKRETLVRALLLERKREKVVRTLIEDLEQYPDLQPVFAAYRYQPVHEPEKLYEAALDDKSNDELELMLMAYDEPESATHIMREQAKRLIHNVVASLPDWVIDLAPYLDVEPIRQMIESNSEEYRNRWMDHLTKASAENKRKGLEYLLYLKTNFMGSVEHYEQFQKLLIELAVTYKG